MAQVLNIPSPGDYKHALERIKKLWNEGKTRVVFHAEERMQERQIDLNDIANVIRYGRIIEHSKPRNNWRYTILGKALDGETTKCVVEINGMLVIVTVI